MNWFIFLQSANRTGAASESDLTALKRHMPDKKNNFQVVWGIALVMMGVMVFFRIPQVMPEIEQIETFSSSIGFIKFCFYFMAVMLVAGGSKKLYRHIAGRKNGAEQ